MGLRAVGWVCLRVERGGGEWGGMLGSGGIGVEVDG